MPRAAAFPPRLQTDPRGYRSAGHDSRAAAVLFRDECPRYRLHGTSHDAGGPSGRLRFVYLGNLLHPVASALNLAIALLRGAVANLLIRYELIHCTQLSLLLRDYSRFVMPQQAAEDRRLVDTLVRVSVTTAVEGMNDNP